MDCSTLDFPVPHHLPEFAQVHVHWISDAIQHISSSAALFSFCLQSFPASGSFPMSQLSSSGGQSIGASASVLPKSIQSWFHLRLTGLVSLLSKGLLAFQESFPALQFESINSLAFCFLNCPALTFIHDYWKTIALTIQTFVGKVISFLFHTLSRFVIAFLPTSNCLLISWLQSPSAVILGRRKRKFVTASTFFRFYLPWSDGTGAMILVF